MTIRDVALLTLVVVAGMVIVVYETVEDAGRRVGRKVHLTKRL